MSQRNSTSPTTRIPLRPLAHQSTNSEKPAFTSWVVILWRALKLILHNWQRHGALTDSSTPGLRGRLCVLPFSAAIFGLFVRPALPSQWKTSEMLAAQLRMSNVLRVLDDINLHGRHLHGSVSSDETPSLLASMRDYLQSSSQSTIHLIMTSTPHISNRWTVSIRCVSVDTLRSCTGYWRHLA